MALAKDQKPCGYSQIDFVQSSTYYGNLFEGSSLELHNVVVEEGENSEKAGGFVNNFAVSRSSSLISSPSSSNANYQPEEAHSVINFKTGYNSNFMHSSGSFLRFDQTALNSCQKIGQQDEYSIWEDFNCVQSRSSFGCMSKAVKENPHGGELFGRANSESNSKTSTIEAYFNKRLHTGENMQSLKRQSTSSATRKSKPKSTPSNDPQSIAAKNRRERISEKLKVLQELVPNGSKVDLVTMLEKAISYVKFLQLQVKVLATDEFWPVQGGKAPNLAQVMEAIDAILSSQKDRHSISK